MNIKKSKSCPECGTPITKDAAFCPHCGKAVGHYVITTANESKVFAPPLKINTVEDMENYLQKLSKYANESAAAALKAQMQVIRYVQSPKLYDNSFDMLFKNIKDALKYADTPRMQEQIQERSSIMIQNWVFFLEAKLQFEKAVNRKEYEELVEDACKVLAESTAEVATLAIPVGGIAAKMTMKAAVTKVTSNMVASKDKNGNSLLAKAYRWWTKDTRAKEKEGEFIITINTLTTKLYKQRELIGKSDLIAGIVNRYAYDMTEYFYGEELEIARRRYNYTYDIALEKWKKTLWIILAVHIPILFIR